MGAYSPAPAATPAVVEAAMEAIVRPALASLAAMGRPYRGVLFAGLMLTADGPKLVEFNARFGDPETQALMALFEGDLALTLKACAEGDLSRAPVWGLSDKAAVAVVMAAQGYPDDPLKGAVVRGLPAAMAVEGAIVFSAGLGQDPEGRFIANGGRVLTLTGTGATIAQAAEAAYAAARAIDWPTGFFRRDIAWRALGPR
jgi:phosphoribosylamine--glycine ligase